MSRISSNYNAIPNELKRLKNWVCWQATPDERSHSGISKKPINPRTGGFAMSNNPETWTDFDTAIAESGKYSGIGFMFGGSGYFGVDIDDMPEQLEQFRNGGNSIIAEFIETLQSYAEYSQSKTGIHIICRGKLPKGGRKKKHSFGGFEMYDSGRFFVMTGDYCSEYMDITDCTESIKPLHAKYIGAGKEPSPRARSSRSVPSTAADIIHAAMNAKNGSAFRALYGGDISAYSSHSEADMALCNMLAFWTSCDADMMDAIFRSSGLMREKWDRKQAGTTYGAITIQKAIAGCTEIYSPRSGSGFSSVMSDSVAADQPGSALPGLSKFTYDDITRHKADDIGTAELFADLVKDFVCYVPEEKAFYLYNGIIWEQDVVKENIKAGKLLMDFVAAAQRLIPPPPAGRPQEWPEEVAEQEKINKAFRNQYHSLGNANGRDRVLKDVKKLLYKSRNRFDRQPNLLNCVNGTYNLDTGELQPHNAEDLLTKCTRASHDPDAVSERFDRFIEEICEDDREQMNALQKALGYSLIGATPEECFFIAYGKSTRNGKGTLFDLVLDTLGDYGAQMDFDVIARSGTKDASRATPELARLIGTRYILVNEPQKGTCFNEGLTKQLTGSDNITARPLYGATIEFKPLFTIYITTNNLPAISDDTLFTSDRIRILPFNRHFTEAERNTKLKATLRESNGRDAVLRWLIEGYRKYKEEGLTDTAASKVIIRQYREENDYIAQFIGECMEVFDQTDRHASKERLTNILARYRYWCDSSNIKPLGRKQFKEELQKHGIVVLTYNKQDAARVRILEPHENDP